MEIKVGMNTNPVPPRKENARLKKLTLTDKAWEYLSKTMKMVDMQEERMRRGLSQEELDNFFATLDKVKQNLENEND